MPIFVVVLFNKERGFNQYLYKAAGSVILWASDIDKANKYTSKYQAKRHLKELDNVPDDVKIVELVMEKGNNQND